MKGQSESGILQSLNQGVEVLRLLSMFGPMRNKDLAEKTGLSRPAISRIIKTLKLSGMVDQISNKGPVTLGTGAAVIGGAYHLQSQLFLATKPLFERFVSQTGFSLLLVTLDKFTGKTLYLTGIEDESIEDYSGDKGTLFSAFETAIGRVALGLADKELQENILKLERENYSESEMKSFISQSAKETARYRSAGYISSHGEAYKTLSACSVFVNIPGLSSTSLTCIGISRQLSEEVIVNEISDRLISLSLKIERIAGQYSH